MLKELALVGVAAGAQFFKQVSLWQIYGFPYLGCLVSTQVLVNYVLWTDFTTNLIIPEGNRGPYRWRHVIQKGSLAYPFLILGLLGYRLETSLLGILAQSWLVLTATDQIFQTDPLRDFKTTEVKPALLMVACLIGPFCLTVTALAQFQKLFIKALV